MVHPQLLAFRHVLPHQLLLGGSVVAMGGAATWAAKLEKSVETLGQLAAKSRAGAGGLLFLPYLSGELQPVDDGNARALTFSASGFPRLERDMVRAVFEGTAFAIRHNLELISKIGEPIRDIRAVGGPTRNALWCQTIADVTGCPLSVLTDNAGAPLGNALLAALGIDLIEDVAEVAQKAAVISGEPRRA